MIKVVAWRRLNNPDASRPLPIHMEGCLEMIENTSRAEWPITPHRARKRRDSRIAYHDTSRHYHRNVPGVSTARPHGSSTSRPSVQIHQQSSPAFSNDPDQSNFWNFQSSPVYNSTSGVADFEDSQVEAAWQASMMFYPFPTLPQDSPQSAQDHSSSPFGPPAQISSHVTGMPWHIPHADADNFNSDMDVIPMSDGQLPWDTAPADADIPMSHGQFGSFNSLDSMALSDHSTMASSISDTYVLTGPASTADSPGDTDEQRKNLTLPEGYFHTMHNPDPSSPSPGNSVSPISPLFHPDVFSFENEPFPIMPDWNLVNNVYGTDTGQWSSATLTQPEQLPNFHVGQSSIPPQIPWSPRVATFHTNADAGCAVFEPLPGSTCDTFTILEEYLGTRQPVSEDRGPQQAASPVWEDSENEWQHVATPSYPNSSVPSHSSPKSESGSSPFSLIDSPPPNSSPRIQVEAHKHVFSAYPGISKPKMPRGRQRALTTREKKEAREVREAKACWACHLCKIKCSPCSPGSPCQQCSRLMGKRRFCLLPCFNDPLESLYTFMVPDYLMGHFTRANVEQFVRDNTTGWGTQEILVRMRWGYRKPLEALVVTLEIQSDSQLRFQHQTAANGTSRPTLVRKNSPPLGIPLAAMDYMEDEYRLLVEDIVRDDLANYVAIAYDDQESELPERLLTAIAAFYNANQAAGEEYDLLRRTLEIHVTSTILERSLILDDESIAQVESRLQQKYPERSAARCAQRQIKLAFFEVQRKRIVKVLEEWGAMMWTGTKSTSIDKKWALSFSVFLGLTLAIDKTLEQGYYFCEGRIAHHGYAAASERRKFQELVRLTQTELFERCKEIFHSSFKSRKNGKEACNPIRDGLAAFKGRQLHGPIARFVEELQGVVHEFDLEVKSHRSSIPEDPSEEDEPYTDAGRLACIFLDDFLFRS